MTFTVAAQMLDKTWVIKENTHYSFSGEDRVLYLFDDQGAFAYVNFDQCLQIGAMPEESE